MKDARSVQLMTAFVKSGGYRSLKLAEEKKETGCSRGKKAFAGF